MIWVRKEESDYEMGKKKEATERKGGISSGALRKCAECHKKLSASVSASEFGRNPHGSTSVPQNSKIYQLLKNLISIIINTRGKIEKRKKEKGNKACPNKR